MKVYTSEELIAEGHTIGIFFSDNQTNEEDHSHEFIEIIYVTSGAATHYIDGISYDVERGDLLFINYGSTHSFRALDNFSYANICFSPEVVANSIITRENAPALLSLTAFDEMRREKNAGKISFSGEDRKEIERLIETMLKEYESCLPYSDKVIENCMSIIMMKMLRKTETGGESISKDWWEELAEYIDENIGESLTLSSLAKKSFYNPSYFSRIFKQKFGVSLTDYIGKRRVDMAIELLANESISLDEIIRRCGFSDRSSFYHSFSKYKGIPPSDFRAKNSKK